MYTLVQTRNWAHSYIDYSPLSSGFGFEPALSIGNMVRNTILNSPFSWPWNRNEFLLTGATALAAGTQDYTFNVTNFSWLEKISLVTADGTYGWELKDIYNTYQLGVSGTTTPEQGQPQAAMVKYYTPGTSVSIRFLSNPDQAYTGALTYQVLAQPFQVFGATSAGTASGGNTTYTGTFNVSSFIVTEPALVFGFTNSANNGTFPIVSVSATTLVLANPSGVAETRNASAINIAWWPIPDYYLNIYNALFLGEALAVVDDARAQTYRQRGMMKLLAKAQGLSDMQKNAFLEQYLVRGSMHQGILERAKQGTEARGT